LSIEPGAKLNTDVNKWHMIKGQLACVAVKSRSQSDQTSVRKLANLVGVSKSMIADALLIREYADAT
jgi:hypothetical protein